MTPLLQAFEAKNRFCDCCQRHTGRMVSPLCSADWNQVRNADKLPGDWSGRCWYGLLGNFYEAYDFLLSLGLLSDSNATTREKSKSKVNLYQSEFNKLLQFGSSARATKTAGSHGENPGKTISLGITCNMHLPTCTLQHAPGLLHPNGAGRAWKPRSLHQGKVPHLHWPPCSTT